MKPKFQPAPKPVSLLRDSPHSSLLDFLFFLLCLLDLPRNPSSTKKSDFKIREKNMGAKSRSSLFGKKQSTYIPYGIAKSNTGAAIRPIVKPQGTLGFPDQDPNEFFSEYEEEKMELYKTNIFLKNKINNLAEELQYIRAQITLLQNSNKKVSKVLSASHNEVNKLEVPNSSIYSLILAIQWGFEGKSEEILELKNKIREKLLIISKLEEKFEETTQFIEKNPNEMKKEAETMMKDLQKLKFRLERKLNFFGTQQKYPKLGVL